MKRPASQYYWGDWRRDTALQSCSLTARGLWHEMNCLMHDCEPYGHLTVGAGPMQPAQLARLVGISPKECAALLSELEGAGVFSRTDAGVIFSRRMVRDEDLRERRAAGGPAGAQHGAKGAEHGAKGGRPKPGKGGSETPLGGDEKPPPAFASASAEKVSDEPNGSSSSAEPTLPGFEGEGSGKPKPTVPCPYGAIVDAYHQALPSLPAVRLRDGPTWVKRQKAMRALWGWVLSSRRPGENGQPGQRRAETAEQALDWIRSYFARAAENDHVMGRTARSPEHANWVADFDYLLSEKGIRNVIERTRAA